MSLSLLLIVRRIAENAVTGIIDMASHFGPRGPGITGADRAPTPNLKSPGFQIRDTRTFSDQSESRYAHVLRALHPTRLVLTNQSGRKMR
jgi:hypothetical protein